jgi:hypothetical protein
MPVDIRNARAFGDEKVTRNPKINRYNETGITV